MTPDRKTVSLKSPTFIGLLLAQFTATFNDQAIHMVAVFYATDLLDRYADALDGKTVLTLVTACFITPFVFLSPLAGVLSDRYSKRTMIVFWKVAEVAMMVLAMIGLAMPAWSGSFTPDAARFSAGLVMASVFFMGLHSTFFVPAKYGIMPELLAPEALSRGNGFLEGTSFMAQIFGTSAGGILYAFVKSDFSGGKFDPGQEWKIGVLLVTLSLIGTITAFLMKQVPPAAPDRVVHWNWLIPLIQNLTLVVRSRQLLLSVIGVASIAFLTLFLRQTLLYSAELEKEIDLHRAPAVVQAERLEGRATTFAEALKESELRVALLIALVGFGVGVGSLAAGYMSGDHVELGMVPLGAVAMTVLALLMAFFINVLPLMVVVLFLLGTSAGFILVPLYTQLQHRAPKESKGNVIAAANFVYVIVGIGALVLFFICTAGLEKAFRPEIRKREQLVDPVARQAHLEALEHQRLVPRGLLLATSLLTATMTALLYLRQPDSPIRAGIWLSRLRSGNRGFHLDTLRADGPVILQTECRTLREAVSVQCAADRPVTLVRVESDTETSPSGLLKLLCRWSGLRSLTADALDPAWNAAREAGSRALKRGRLVMLAYDPAAPSLPSSRIDQLIRDWQGESVALVMPVVVPFTGAP